MASSKRNVWNTELPLSELMDDEIVVQLQRSWGLLPQIVDEQNEGNVLEDALQAGPDPHDAKR